MPPGSTLTDGGLCAPSSFSLGLIANYLPNTPPNITRDTFL